MMNQEDMNGEELKEIIGEEWRKISRILDRFLLLVFTISSLAATLWCVFVSPHFPQAMAEEEGFISYS